MPGKKPGRSSIQRQLLLNILPALVISILLFSYFNYRHNRNELARNYETQLKQIVQEVQSLSSLYDYAQKVHEKSFNSRMEDLSVQLANTIRDKNLDPERVNLYELSLQMGMDTTREFIYIINRNGVVVNTTFKKDLGLDFFTLDTLFKPKINTLFNNKKFKAERFSLEMSTGLIKKYSFIPTYDGKYLVELGIQSDDAQALRSLLDSLTGDISKQFPEFRQIVSELSIKGIDISLIKDSVLNVEAFKAIETRSNREYAFEKNGEKLVANFIYLPVENSDFFDGFIIMTLRDTSREQALLRSEIKRFSLITVFTVIPIMLLVYFRARKITRPIQNLASKATLISSGKLDERIIPEGNNEVTTLSENFNLMVEKLQESYEGLEQKVRERTAEISQQKHIIEEKNKEIVDSINYAKRIQDAILPTPSTINKLLPNCFVLYKPKDIVAGDFYWMESREKIVMIAAADCTGHGVPGAMVSVVCSGALTRSVKEFGLTNPGKILDKTTELVVETFDRNQSDVKDGMDINLCSINLSHNVLMYAGANNPLWILRKNAHGVYENMEIKADKQPIGKFEDRKPFTTHIHEILPGDCVYLFTDGFADQFGGEKGKKFKYSTFLKALTDCADKTLEEQKVFLDRIFENWKGHYEQTDDVCVIGIKF